jgi:hypothetical protein
MLLGNKANISHPILNCFLLNIEFRSYEIGAFQRDVFFVNIYHSARRNIPGVANLYFQAVFDRAQVFSSNGVLKGSKIDRQLWEYFRRRTFSYLVAYMGISPIIRNFTGLFAVPICKQTQDCSEAQYVSFPLLLFRTSIEIFYISH